MGVHYNAIVIFGIDLKRDEYFGHTMDTKEGHKLNRFYSSVGDILGMFKSTSLFLWEDRDNHKLHVAAIQ